MYYRNRHLLTTTIVPGTFSQSLLGGRGREGGGNVVKEEGNPYCSRFPTVFQQYVLH